MPYVPPSGWVERITSEIHRADNETDEQERVRFHVRRDCQRIQQPHQLTAVDRPYSATRCTLCAPEH